MARRTSYAYDLAYCVFFGGKSVSCHVGTDAAAVRNYAIRSGYDLAKRKRTGHVIVWEGRLRPGGSFERTRRVKVHDVARIRAAGKEKRRREERRRRRRSMSQNARRTSRGRPRRSAAGRVTSALGLIRKDGVQDPPPAKLSARVRKHLARQPAGLYRVSAGRSPAISKFGGGVSVQSAMTSTRIASSRSREGHYLVKVYPKGSPKIVVLRYIAPSGETKYRVEEWGDALRAVKRDLGFR